MTVTGGLPIDDVFLVCGLGPQKSTDMQNVVQNRTCKAGKLKILEMLNSTVETFKNVKSLSWIG
jgi:hypothetical protein